MLVSINSNLYLIVLNQFRIAEAHLGRKNLPSTVVPKKVTVNIGSFRFNV